MASKLNYAIQRLEGIYSQKRDAIKVDMKKVAPKAPTYRQVLSDIKSGKLKMIHEPLDRAAGYYYDDGSFRLNSISFNGDCYAVKNEAHAKAVDKRVEVLDKEFTKIKDELMLGDNEKALMLISQFSQAKF